MNMVKPGMMALFVLTAGAQAQWTVTEFYDAPAVNAPAGPDADPAPGVQVTLRSVVQHINTLPAGAHTVALPAGIYVLNVVGHGENSALTGDIDILRSIEFTGAGPTTRIDASALQDRILDVRAPVRVVLRRLGLDAGTAVPGAAGPETGGAIRAVAGSTIELSDTEFVGNSATGSPGADAGAIDAGGGLVMTGLNLFSGNFATGFGGAVLMAGASTIDGAWFDQNDADAGGGALANLGSCDISNTTLSDNIANGLASSDLGGGAIYNSGTLTLLNSTVSDNDAPNGLGGGILNQAGGDAHLTHVTMLGNLAAQGASVHNGTTGPAAMRMTHTVLSSPAIAGPGTTGFSLPLTSLGYNLDADGTAGLAGVGDLAGTLGAPINPRLSSLLLNGVGTATHHPLGAGPTRDGGNPAGSFDHNGNPVTRDQRGSARPGSGSAIPDLGAIETPCFDRDLFPSGLGDGIFNFFDWGVYMTLYQNLDPTVDIAPPFGVWNVFDIFEALTFGCY